MKLLPEVMKGITQAEVNRACTSRNYAVLDDMLMRVSLELIVMQEEIDDSAAPTKQQLYHLRIIKMNKERLEKRITHLATKSQERSRRMIVENENRRLALALISGRQQKQTLRQEELNAKYVPTDEQLAYFDPIALKIKQAVLKTGVDFKTHAINTKDAEKKDEFKIKTAEEWDLELSQEERAQELANDALNAVQMRECSDCQIMLLPNEPGPKCNGCILTQSNKSNRALLDDVITPRPKQEESKNKLVPKFARSKRGFINQDIDEINELQKLRGDL